MKKKYMDSQTFFTIVTMNVIIFLFAFSIGRVVGFSEATNLVDKSFGILFK